MTPVSLRIDALTKSFGSEAVLNNFSLNIPMGQVTALMGASGSGKSTLLRIIAGLEQADTGTVSYAGEPISNGQVGFIFQEPVLYPHLNVQENILFAYRLAKAPALDREHFTSLIGTLGLGEYLHKKPSQLSGGQAQRAGIARALVRKTPLVLFDEPLSNVDPHLAQAIRADILTLHHQLGFTGLYVTHTPDEALQMGQEIAVMEQGQLVQTGPARQLLQKPANLQVARLLNPLYNELPAELEGQTMTVGISAHGFSPRYEAGQGALPVIPRSAWAYTSGTRVEALIARDTELSTAQGLLCLPAGMVITAVLPGLPWVELGKTMYWAVDAENLHYF
ncbi:ABC transporter ATP-binding protein [Rothia sp. P5766]|uniref:ABC transporter ATP-binding protein n=1 Tax=Rothia sp. P5766 TaxID=3402656 RepID=UPI003AEC5865